MRREPKAARSNPPALGGVMQPDPPVCSQTGNASDSPLLAMGGIWKEFGRVAVLKGVDFEVRSGEVHALCGENGAGKSTLMNVLAGVSQPDAGTIILKGRSVTFASAHAAQRHGIATVFQERSLFPGLTVADNIFVGRHPMTPWGTVDRKRLLQSTRELLEEFVPGAAPDLPVAELSAAQQQMVEIAKAVSLNAKVIVFDEPTAALTVKETTPLFAVIHRLKARGVGIVYISHRLEEVYQLCDRVTVLKDGVNQGTFQVQATTRRDLIRRMVGRDVEAPASDGVSAVGQRLLDVRNLSDRPRQNGAQGFLQDISLCACAGEVVGMAGLAGAGRTETALSIFGVRDRGAGKIFVAGKSVVAASPAEAIAAGIGYLSEDRRESGLFLTMPVARNITVASLQRFGTWRMQQCKEYAVAEEFKERLGLICRDVEQDAGSLSGGNQQKVLLARWLLVAPSVLIADEPTRGVDIGAKAEMHRLLREYAQQGHAVIVISSDLPEILTLCDRVYVMRTGRISGHLARHELTEEAVMALASLGVAGP